MVSQNDNNNQSPNTEKPASDPSGQGTRPTPKKSEFPTVAKYARRQKQRNIALVVLGVGTVGVATLAILAFLGRTSGQFTIKMNPQLSSEGLKMTETLDGPQTSYLLAPGLESANLDTAKDVFSYIDEIPVEGMGGSYNKSKGASDTSSGIQTALVYTFYIHNTSSEATSFLMSFNVEDYVAPENDAYEPYSYLRFALFETNAYDESTEDVTVYAMRNTAGSGTAVSSEDRRECLSTFTQLGDTRTPTYTYDGVGYCEEFAANYKIFEKDCVLPAYSVNRYTVAVWGEGNDPDCKGIPPEGTSFTFSMNMNSI